MVKMRMKTQTTIRVLYTKYIKFLSILLNGEALPLEARNHNLIGDYSGFKEFHIGGDLLVIYCIEDDILRLTRIGK